MPITVSEIKTHREQYDLGEIDTLHTTEYRRALSDGAFFWIDHHDFVRSTFTEEIFATNREQLDAMIEHLQQYRDRMPSPPKWMSEK